MEMVRHEVSPFFCSCDALRLVSILIPPYSILPVRRFVKGQSASPPAYSWAAVRFGRCRRASRWCFAIWEPTRPPPRPAA